MMDLKKDFPIFETYPDLAYLDNAATSQTPNSVLEKMHRYYDRYRSNVHRGLYPIAEQASVEYEKARQSVAKFIHAEPTEVIFTSGATDSMNRLVAMLEHANYFAPGDEIVTTVMEHHAVLVPLIELAKRKGLKLNYAPLKKDLTLDDDALLALISGKTKLVAVSMASNVLGSTTDGAKICERARFAGALTVVDAAKAAGHLPIDVRELNCDFLFFSGHKMCGPTGIGVLFGKEEQLAKLAPGTYGGGMIRCVSQQEATYLDTIERFEAGTPPIAEAIGLSEAVRYLDTIGLNEIHEHISQLVAEATEMLNGIESVTIFAAPAKQNAGVVSFSIESIHSHDVAEILGRNNVAVRAGHHCAEPLMQELGVRSLARVSFSLYNTSNDIKKLRRAILKTIELFA